MNAKQQTTKNIKPKTIIIDSREKADIKSEMISCLGAEAYTQEEALYCGDYWLVGEVEEVLIERKGLLDLESSFFNKRLDSEIAKMISWKAKRQEEFPEKLIRIRLMIEGSYITSPIQMRLLTYQGLGLEVIWGDDGRRMLLQQFRSVMKGKHEIPRTKVFRSGADKLPMKEQILVPVLNKKQRAMVLKNCESMEALCGIFSYSDKINKWPGFGPKTIEKLREALIWR